MRTVAVIQARMGSTRLPGKALLPLLGRPMLAHVIRRTSRARLVDVVAVATTTLPSDESIVDLAVREGCLITRGSETDLLDRYVRAARELAADTVVRITSDCPIIDPEVIDATIAALIAADCDYASNALEPRTFPRGLEVEVVTRAALERAWREDDDLAWREHATPYIYRHPEVFELLRVPAADDHSSHRWSVDTPEDLDLVTRIYAALGRDDFGWREALTLVESNPGWAELNRHVIQKAVPP